jgi:predicted glycoside hydrolase/deacetylase ChbG (UPF0249 family)
MHIIINADDLGMSAEVNDAIFELMSTRRVTSATIMANGPAVHAATAQLRRFPSCSFGVHLNLTQFEPLTAGDGASMLTRETGQLSRWIETAVPTIALLRAAYEECCAQIELLASAGVAISHFDSHNHVHTRPQIFPVLKALQKRYRIRKVRLAKNLYSDSQPYPGSLRWKKRAYNIALRRIYRTETTEAFTELLTFAELTAQRSLRYHSVELMVHPGASYAAAETALLQSDWLPNLSAGATVITYRQLGA